VRLIADKKYREANDLIKQKLPLPSSIGRVCPRPCEDACRRKLVEEPISIAHLKYFAADKYLGGSLPAIEPGTGKSVAVIGGGPGGLTAAYFLRRMGHAVTVYDAMPHMGGMLRYGIPEYRLPKSILDKEIALIAKMGVTLKNNTKITDIAKLRKTHDAVVIAIGAWSSIKLGCKGEDLNGVIGGIDFLREVAEGKRPDIGKNVAVVGGGNTAMDACRTAVRLGAEKVYNIYRRTKSEMPAQAIEIEEAEEENVSFIHLTNPIEVFLDGVGRSKKMRLQKMKLGEPDASGRRSPVPIAGAEEILDVDTVIVAIGQSVVGKDMQGVTLTKWGTVSADEATYLTNLDGVFAVGDATNKGADIAITAVGEAKRAAQAIDNYLKGKPLGAPKPYLVKTEPSADDYTDYKKASRAKMRHLKPEVRRTNFEEVNAGYNEKEAIAEAARCLECGCADYEDRGGSCKLIKYANQYNVQPEKYGNSTAGHKTDNDKIPNIKQTPDKCILCGLCVRVCEEVVGAGVLGFTGRGFDTAVCAEFGSSNPPEVCITCGKCADACPTGALIAVGDKNLKLITDN